MCYERYKSLSWALGRREHILSCKRTRPPDVCLYSLFYGSVLPCSILGIISRPPTPIDGFLYHAGTSSSSFCITLSRRLWTTIPRANLERLDEYASTASYFRSKFTYKLPAEIPCIIINSPLSFLAQRIVYSWRDKPMSFKKNFSEAILLKRKSQLQGCPINLRSVR